MKKKLVAFIFVILLSFNFLTNCLVIHPKSCPIDVQFDSRMLPVESKKTQKDVSRSKEHAYIFAEMETHGHKYPWVVKININRSSPDGNRYNILALTFYFCCQRWRVLNLRIDATNIEGFFFQFHSIITWKKFI